MNDRLPVNIEKNELPIDYMNKRDNSNSYGYISILYLLSVIITMLTIIVTVFFGKR